MARFHTAAVDLNNAVRLGRPLCLCENQSEDMCRENNSEKASVVVNTSLERHSRVRSLSSRVLTCLMVAFMSLSVRFVGLDDVVS